MSGLGERNVCGESECGGVVWSVIRGVRVMCEREGLLLRGAVV